MINLGDRAGRPRLERAVVERIRDWIGQTGQWPADAHIMVTELQCSEPGCPPVETVIAVMAGPGDTRQFKVHRPASELGEADIRQAIGVA